MTWKYFSSRNFPWILNSQLLVDQNTFDASIHELQGLTLFYKEQLVDLEVWVHKTC